MFSKKTALIFALYSVGLMAMDSELSQQQLGGFSTNTRLQQQQEQSEEDIDLALAIQLSLEGQEKPQVARVSATIMAPAAITVVQEIPHASIGSWTPGSYGNFPGVSHQQPSLPIWVQLSFDHNVTDDFAISYCSFLKASNQLMNIYGTPQKHGVTKNYIIVVDSSLSREQCSIELDKANKHFDPGFERHAPAPAVRPVATTSQQIQTPSLLAAQAPQDARITEVINSTNENLFIENRRGIRANGINVIHSYSLETGKELQTSGQRSHIRTIFGRKTRNIVSGLIIPTVSIDRGTQVGVRRGIPPAQRNGDHLCLIMDGCGVITTIHPGPFLTLYRVGDLLGLNACNGVARVMISDQTIPGQPNQFHWGMVTGEKLGAAEYSIQVKQLKPMITYIPMKPTIPWLMSPDVLEVTINKIDPSKAAIPQATSSTKTHARIVRFYPGSITHGSIVVDVEFDQTVTDKFNDNFCEFMRSIGNMRRVSKISGGGRYVRFEIYTDITQEAFQLMLDQANQHNFN